MYKNIIPLGQKVIPLGRKVVPLGQKVRLLAQKVDVLTFNAISIAYFANLIIIKVICRALVDEPHFGNYTSINPTVNRRVDTYRVLLPFSSPLGKFDYSS